MAAQLVPSEPLEIKHSEKSVVSRAEKLMAKYTHLPASSIKTLTAVLDPFHDEELQPWGLPDGSVRKTQLLFIRRQTQITLGSSEATLHVAILPHNQSVVQSNGGVVQGSRVLPNTGVVPLGTVTWATSTTGNCPWPNYANDGTAVQSGSLSPDNIANTGAPDSTFTSSNHRLIGVAFELVNTTPSAYAGGSITVYNTNIALDHAVYKFDDNLKPFWNSADFYRAPPVDVSQASLIPNARTWAASQGAYVVGRPSQPSIPWRRCIPRTLGMVGQTVRPGADPGQFIAFVGPVSDDGLPIQYNISNNDFTMSGLIATIPPVGAVATTYTLTARFLLEVAPDDDGDVALVSAYSAPPRDPNFFTAWSDALHSMPPGVPVDENFLGQWFTDVVGGLADMGGLIGGALGGPAGASIGGGIGSLVKSILPKKEKRLREEVSIAVPPPAPSVVEKVELRAARPKRKRTRMPKIAI